MTIKIFHSPSRKVSCFVVRHINGMVSAVKSSPCIDCDIDYDFELKFILNFEYDLIFRLSLCIYSLCTYGGLLFNSNHTTKRINLCRVPVAPPR